MTSPGRSRGRGRTPRGALTAASDCREGATDRIEPRRRRCRMRTTHVLRNAFAFTGFAASVLGEVEGVWAFSGLATPPFSIPTSGSTLCTAVNLSGAAHTVTIEVRDFAGNLVPFTNANCSATNPKSTPVGAGEISAIACNGSGNRYCTFAIKGGGKNAVRGVLRAFDASDQTIAVLPAE